MAEYIEREAAIAVIYGQHVGGKEACENARPNTYGADLREIVADIEEIPAADVRPVPEGGIGEMSDGYHTFNGLYYQRMVLFAALVRAFRGKAWKSWKHEDGEPCFGGGWFIVGIDTPQGSYTYHYDKMYWNLFECEELPTAKHWDGHTEEDVTRLLSLDVRPVVRAEWYGEADGYADGELVYDMWSCPICGKRFEEWEEKPNWNFCPNCGADMREVDDG